MINVQPVFQHTTNSVVHRHESLTLSAVLQRSILFGIVFQHKGLFFWIVALDVNAMGDSNLVKQL